MRLTPSHKKKPRLEGRKALFLDRDGVINFDSGYTCNWSPDIIIPGIIDLISRFKKRDYLVIVVTNQSGIGRGYYSEIQFLDFMSYMMSYLKEYDAPIDDFFYCSCNPLEKSCINRKPSPGLFLKAIKNYDIDPTLSFMVGDKMSDIEAAARADIRHNYLFDAHGKLCQKQDEDIEYKVLSYLRDLEVI